MPRLSPHHRAQTERGRNRRANAILIALISVVFAAIWVLRDPAIFSVASNVKQADLHRESVEQAPRDPGADSGAKSDQWQERIAVIKSQIPTDSSELQTIHYQLDQLSEYLTHQYAALSIQSPPGQRISEELDAIAKHVAALTTTPTIDASEFPSQLDAASAALRQHDDDNDDAIQRAVQEVHKKWEPKMHTVRLALRDRQDEAATLRDRIAKADREQTVLRAKESRAESLNSQMADVDKYLTPFTAPGYLQPNSKSNAWDTRRTPDAMPVSLSGLERLGALEQTMEGLERLYMFGGGKNAAHNNSRPLGLFPKYAAYYIKQPQVQAAVKRAQQLLREHGQALVEARLLSP